MASSSSETPIIDMGKALETPARNLPFDPLSILIAGVQVHKQEYVSHKSYELMVEKYRSMSRKNEDDGPRYATWRNNLTALSQYRNLYFIASFNQIHVYKPHFPNQTLSSKPQLIIDLPVSGLGLTGYIDRRRPHSVNHMIVGCLGGEEILLMACDDGDVLGYNTRNIFAVICQKEDDDDEEAALPENKGKIVTPFFHENVYRSAWGLAVHKSARMIAVSCNTTEITVFAFALTKKEGDNDPIHAHSRENLRRGGQGDWVVISSLYIWDRIIYPDTMGAALSRRELNFRLSLRGHPDNIPSIAFYNSEDDTKGKWLVSTDIKGTLILWDVWKMKRVKAISLDDKRWPNTRGWGVLCLDPRSFKDTSEKKDAFGCEPDILPTRPNVWDISKSKEKPRDYSKGLPSEVVEITAAEALDVVDGDGEDEEYDEMASEPMTYAEYVTDDEFELSEEDENDGSPLYEEDTLLPDEGNAGESTQGSLYHSFDLGADGIARGGLLGFAPSASTTIVEYLADQPPYFPIFVSTIENVRLLESIRLNESCICTKILESKVSDQIVYHLNEMERLNMILHCPDLNLVVIGSQNGSVCLLTLTWGVDRELHGPAFRIEARLPFLSQEKAGAKPRGYLGGIAIGPIQGRELEIEGEGPISGSPRKRKEAWRRVESRRRYRLIMYYFDGTVLSYELGRDDEKGSLLGY